jgi:predicted enzyme related to lactoylglutathione lyase
MTALEAGIITGDGEALAAFYVEGFGFRIDRVLELPQGTVHRLSADRAKIKIFQPIDGAATPARPQPWHRDGGFAYASLHVSDIGVAITRATGHGATVHTPPTDHRPGARFAMIQDPDGNIWELLEEAHPADRP